MGMEEIIDKPDDTLKNEGEKIATMKALSEMRKDVKEKTQEALETHGDRNLVLQEMLEKYGTKNQKIIAQDIAYEISEKDLLGKKPLYYTLVVLQTIVLAIYLFQMIPRLSSESLSIAIYIFAVIHVLFLLWMVKSLFQFKGMILSLVLYFSIYRLIGESLTIYNGEILIYKYIQIAIAVPSIAIAYYLRKRLLPHIGLFGLKKNPNGGYRL